MLSSCSFICQTSWNIHLSIVATHLLGEKTYLNQNISLFFKRSSCKKSRFKEASVENHVEMKIIFIFVQIDLEKGTKVLYLQRRQRNLIWIYIHIYKLFIDNKNDSKWKQINYKNIKRMKYSIENEVLDQIIEIGERQEQVKTRLKSNMRWKRFLIWCQNTLSINNKNYWSYNSKTKERQSFRDRKSYLKKQRKQKKTITITKRLWRHLWTLY